MLQVRRSGESVSTVTRGSLTYGPNSLESNKTSEAVLLGGQEGVILGTLRTFVPGRPLGIHFCEVLSSAREVPLEISHTSDTVVAPFRAFIPPA